MSNKNLHDFLIKLDKELQGYKEFRKELDREPQTFVFHKRTLLAETITQLSRGSNITLSNTDKAKVKEMADRAGDKLHKDLERVAGNRLKRPGGKTTLIFDKNTGVDIPKGYNPVLPYTAFSRVKFAYRSTLNGYFTELQNYLRDAKHLDTVKNKDGSDKKSIQNFFDAGHNKQAGVFERFLDSTTDSIVEGLDSSTERSSQAERDKLVSEMNALLGTDLSVKKVDDLSTIIIKIESSSANRAAGQKQGQRSGQLRKAIRSFLDNEVALENLKGSDSLKTQKIKKTTKAVIKPFLETKNKNIKVSTNLKKTKKSSKTTVKRSVKPKIKGKGTNLNTKVNVKKARRAPKKSMVTDLLPLIAQLNKELPEAVRRNMESPSLVNRTGRFAESVRIVDATRTPKGFPSFGYTYQRDPYQVFEDGAGSPPWANGQRDPRTLIDRSIREVATQRALGRFFTRRV